MSTNVATNLTQTFTQSATVNEYTDKDDGKTVFCSHSFQVTIPSYHHIQHCSFSFVSDKKGEQVLSGIVEKIDIVSSDHHINTLFDQTLNGDSILVRNAIKGVRSTYDLGHNATHVTLLENVSRCSGEPSILTIAFHVKQLSKDDLKTNYSCKTNEELFSKCELFVATRHTDLKPLNHLQTKISPICKYDTSIPYLTMDKVTHFDIPLGAYLKDLPNVRNIHQIWFTYEVKNITTTSSLFSKLYYQTTDDIVSDQTVRAYSSPVQLQRLDKTMWNLYSSDAPARPYQEKYLTMTFGNIDISELSKSRLRFMIHPQVLKDYTNYVNNARNKQESIKNAQVSFKFGFMYQ